MTVTCEAKPPVTTLALPGRATVSYLSPFSPPYSICWTTLPLFCQGPKVEMPQTRKKITRSSWHSWRPPKAGPCRPGRACFSEISQGSAEPPAIGSAVERGRLSRFLPRPLSSHSGPVLAHASAMSSGPKDPHVALSRQWAGFWADT